MDPILLSISIFVLLFVLIAAGMPIGFAMGLSAFVGTLLLIDSGAALALLGQTAYETGLTYNLSVLPMFVLMGYIAGKGGLSESLYRACNTWLGHRRGGLALATIGGCGAFAAICGSSLATAATMAQIALPEMRRYGYDDRLATGALAAGGTIGILIPPSVLMVIYGLLTETSISALFLAGIVPGVLTVVVFMGALVLGMLNRQLKPAHVGTSLMETVKTTAMIFTILIGAILFNNFLILAGVPDLISNWISGLPLGRTAILIVILLMYVVLGCLLDSLAMVLLTIPIVFPIIKSLGFDPVWFGIIIVMVVELGLITPPIGMNVFVIKAIARDVPLEKLFRGVMPFVVAQILLIAILVAFPQIALWLPSTMAR
jgi:TRAP-type C4-dicarboxylate transport system permease large subunit